MALLLDIGSVPHACADDALEHLCKAVGEDGGGNLWDPPPSPLLRRIVEEFTARGLKRSEALTKELSAWLSGRRHRSEMERPNRPPGMMERWSRAELDLVRAYLQALKPAEFTLEDWLMVVDYLCQRYLPPDDLRSEADWLASRSALMGRIAAALGDGITEAEADTILTALPAPDALGLSPNARAVLDFGRARACEHVTSVSDAQRHRLRNIVVDHQEALYLGDKAQAAESLQSKLLDAEGVMNRDWRRIAVTEATEMLGQGFIAAQKPGTKVRRVEVYRGACAFCRSIDGAVLTVADPKTSDKNGDKEVWSGKTNVGRSASPKMRGPDGLVDRPEAERYWIPAGAAHPNCRGSWVLAADSARDPTFDAWLDSLKGKKA